MAFLIDLNLYASLTALLAYAYVAAVNIELKRWPWVVLAVALSLVSGVFVFGYIQIYFNPSLASTISSIWFRSVLWIIMVGPALAWVFHINELHKADTVLREDIEKAKLAAEKARLHLYSK